MDSCSNEPCKKKPRLEVSEGGSTRNTEGSLEEQSLVVDRLALLKSFIECLGKLELVSKILMEEKRQHFINCVEYNCIVCDFFKVYGVNADIGALTKLAASISSIQEPQLRSLKTEILKKLISEICALLPNFADLFSVKVTVESKCTDCKRKTSDQLELNRYMSINIPCDNFPISSLVSLEENIRICDQCKKETFQTNQKFLNSDNHPKMLMVFIENASASRKCKIDERILTIPSLNGQDPFNYKLKVLIQQHPNGFSALYTSKDDTDIFKCSINIFTVILIYELDLTETEAVKLGKRLCFPVEQDVAFITFEQLKLMQSAKILKDFPDSLKNVIPLRIPDSTCSKDVDKFVQEELNFENELKFDNLIADNKELLKRRTSFLNYISLKLYEGLFVLKTDEITSFMQKFNKMEISTPRIQCGLCILRFRNFTGAYLHLIQTHAPLHLLFKEEYLFLGYNHTSSNQIKEYNKCLLDCLCLETLLFQHEMKNRVAHIFSHNNPSIFARQKVLIKWLCKCQNQILNIPDDLLCYVNPLDWNINLKKIRDPVRLHHKMALCLLQNSKHCQSCAKQKAKRYLIVLLTKENHETVMSKYNGNIYNFLSITHKKLSPCTTPPVILYAGRSSNEEYSTYHFKNMEVKNSILSQYWQTGKFYLWLLASEPIKYEPRSNLSRLDQVAKSELEWILTIKIFSSLCNQANRDEGITFVADQDIGHADIFKFVSTEWLKNCIDYFRNPQATLFCEANETPPTEFQIRISENARCIKESCTKIDPIGMECLKCKLPTISKVTQNYHSIIHKQIVSSDLDSVVTTNEYLSRPDLLINKSSEAILQHILRIQRRSAKRNYEGGLYIVVIDMINSESMDKEQLYAELMTFIRTSKDLNGCENRFLFYIGKNSQGAKPSAYHVVKNIPSSLKINRRKYFIKGIQGKSNCEYQFLVSIFVQNKLGINNHIKFINKTWDKCAVAENSDYQKIFKIVSLSCDNESFFCTDDPCTCKLNEEDIICFNNHLRKKDFRELAGYNEKEEPTPYEKIVPKDNAEEVKDSPEREEENNEDEEKDEEEKNRVPEQEEKIDHKAIDLKMLCKFFSGPVELQFPYKSPAFIDNFPIVDKTYTGIKCYLCKQKFTIQNLFYQHVPECVALKVGKRIFMVKSLNECRKIYDLTLPCGNVKPMTRLALGKKQPWKVEERRRICKTCKKIIEPQSWVYANDIKQHFVLNHPDVERSPENSCLFCNFDICRLVTITMHVKKAHFNILFCKRKL